MPAAVAIPLILAGTSAVSGALANRSKTTTQTSTPTLDPAMSGIQSQVMSSLMSRLSAPSALPAGVAENGIIDTNRVFDLAGQHSANDLTARGLGTSPVAGVVEGNNQNARAGSIATMLNSLPFLNRQLQNEDLGMASSFLQQGRGSTTTGTVPGNMLGGALGNFSNMMAYLYGNGAFNGLGKKSGLAASMSPAMPGTY